MRKVLKGILGLFCIMSIALSYKLVASASTNIYVGKDISDNNSTIISGTITGNSNLLTCVKTVDGEDENSYRYVIFSKMECDRTPMDGCFAMNEKGVSVAISDSFKESAEEEMVSLDVADLICTDSKTARSAVKNLCKMISEDGTSYIGTVIVADPIEAWYMEIYSANQYAAIKCPSDKILYTSDEFILNEEIIEEADKSICSDDLSDMPRNSGNGFVECDELVGLEEVFDGIRTEAGVFKNIVSKDADAGIKAAYATEMFAGVPEEIANVMWVNTSNIKCTPFVPVSNGISSVCDEYSQDLSTNSYVSGVSACEYARLNKLCEESASVTEGVTGFVKNLESRYIEEVNNAIEEEWLDAYEDSEEGYMNAIEIYCNTAMEAAVQLSGAVYDDASWYLLSGDETETFDVSFDIEKYATSMGYEVSISDDIFTAVRDNKEIVIDLSNAKEEDNAAIDETDREVDTDELEVDEVRADAEEVKTDEKEVAEEEEETEEIDEEEIDEEEIVGEDLDEEIKDSTDERVLTQDEIEKRLEQYFGLSIDEIKDKMEDVFADTEAVVNELTDDDLEEIGLDDVSMDDVVDVVDSLDTDTKKGLGELFGVDVDQMIALYRAEKVTVDVDIDVDLDKLGINPEVVEVLQEAMAEAHAPNDIMPVEPVVEIIAEESIAPMAEELIVMPEEAPLDEQNVETIVLDACEDNQDIQVEEPQEEPVEIAGECDVNCTISCDNVEMTSTVKTTVVKRNGRIYGTVDLMRLF